jgi:16S rRNA (cytosine1402-N4)-methyltransferase
MPKEEVYHIPVMLNEAIEGLNINPDGVYVDLTFGGGGHSREIIKHLSSKGELYAFDKDEDAKNNAINDERFCLINDDYSNAKTNLRLYRKIQVNGILADLGVSSHQIDTIQRGFSFQTDAPLDLRMNNKQPIMAADIVNTYTKEQLKALFKDYAELPNSGFLADRIYFHCSKTPIYTTKQLIDLISPLALKGKENKFYAKVFQALRIEVNNELGNLEKMLAQCADLLLEGGRLVVISYHSLEDRRVKNIMKTGNLDGTLNKDFYGNILSPFSMISRKAITPSLDEVEKNPRARSAKLRIAEKK